MFASLFKWEWIVIELIVLGLAVFELVSLRRDERRAQEAKRANDRGDRPV